MSAENTTDEAAYERDCNAYDEWEESERERAWEAMERDEITASGIEALVCADIARRQALGIAKYGQTVAENPLPLREWLQHAYEEALDLAVYLRRAMEEMETKNTCSRCVWKEDEDGSWWSDCDNGFIFNDSGPHENEFEFCPYCGKKITVNLFCDNTEAQATRPAPNNDEN